MIYPARLHPSRVVRSLHRRLLSLVDRRLRRPPGDMRHVESTQSIITRHTLEKLVGRVTLPDFTVTYSDRQQYRTDGTYHREAGRYVLELSTVDDQYDFITTTRELGPAYLYWLMHCPPEVEFVSVTLSDGNAPSGARFAPSTNNARMVPLPDPYFFRNTGFEQFRQLAARRPVAWADRSSEIVWRGVASGHGTFDPVLGTQWPGLAAQRLAVILAGQPLEGVDAALSGYARSECHPQLLERAGILKQELPEASWARRKFAIDVDGWTNTWSNLFVRMLLGCCVLKLDSKFGYRQWYYDRLIPWEHYVPVKADASDLGEMVEWVRANDARAAEIARNGQRLVRSMSFEAVRDEAVNLITAHWRG